jgi:hypothetical protein
MPVTRGKKKTKRERRRFGAVSSTAGEGQPAPVASRPAKPAAPRRRWKPPLWVNVFFGVTLIVGGPFFASVFKGGFIILIAYWLMGGFYLFQAYRQYREKRIS